MKNYGILSLLALIALLAICFASVRFLVIRLATLTDKPVAFECAGWKYRAETTGMNAVLVKSSSLAWKDKPVPRPLLVAGFSLKTPIGEFSPSNGKWVPHFAEPPWWSDAYQPPCAIDGKFVEHDFLIEEAVKRGFYRTPVKGVSIAGAWANTRLEGTPLDWVHVSLQNEDFWVDPNRLDELPLGQESDRHQSLRRRGANRWLLSDAKYSPGIR